MLISASQSVATSDYLGTYSSVTDESIMINYGLTYKWLIVMIPGMRIYKFIWHENKKKYVRKFVQPFHW